IFGFMGDIGSRCCSIPEKLAYTCCFSNGNGIVYRILYQRNHGLSFSISAVDFYSGSQGEEAPEILFLLWYLFLPADPGLSSLLLPGVRRCFFPLQKC